MNLLTHHVIVPFLWGLICSFVVAVSEHTKLLSDQETINKLTQLDMSRLAGIINVSKVRARKPRKPVRLKEAVTAVVVFDSFIRCDT